mmetsp:Transcript_25094/g.87537  ORF Transcript_25094/g.87537 Transcript_25094/m.87537 type:complete len:352 (-) Transcript_25094:49-1104(-)
MAQSAMWRAVGRPLRAAAIGGAAKRSPCAVAVRWQTTVAPDVTIFNRAKKREQRNAAARLADSKEYDYLRDEVAARLVDRLNDIKRSFPVAADIGCGNGHILRALAGHGDIETLYMTDISEGALARDAASRAEDAARANLKVVPLVADEEFLPFAPASLDLVMSSMAMHWVNDLPSFLSQVRAALKPDGVFIAAMVGGETLYELRGAFATAEMELSGGVQPHMSPMTMMADVGGLMSSAGFTMPTVDIDTISVEYPTPQRLFEHLRNMGESNALEGRKVNPNAAALRDAAAQKYVEMYGDEEGYVPATFEVVHMIGWAPAESQPKPLERGSATASFKDLGSISGGDVPGQS